MTNRWILYSIIVCMVHVFSGCKAQSGSMDLSHSSMKNLLNSVRVEPPNWFTGMQNRNVEVLLRAENITNYSCRLTKEQGVRLDQIKKLPNPNYIILKLTIDELAPAQSFEFVLSNGEDQLNIPYELKPKSATPKPIDGGDVLYLIMPDRFANGDPETDNIEGMRESADRSYHGGKHGGDLRGIINNLDYLEDLGITTIWLNPVYENNMERYSYHGYSITDHFKVDPRLGSLQIYREFADKAHDRGMKVIKDMIFNHIGSFHYWMSDMPDPDWINQWDEFTRTNYSGSTVTDPYASKVDHTLMTKGWFDVTMPDLNQSNKTLMTYLTQHSIWWIEMAGIDGIRMDTYPYPEKYAMAKWVDDILAEYPGFYIVGETWLYTPVQLAFWTNSKLMSEYSSNLPSVSDFGITWAIDRAFREDKGIWELYQILTNDFIYETPNSNKIFVDNHDMDRSLAVLENDLNKFFLAYTFLLTTRGIPQYFYGTEIGMSGKKPDGVIREDMPGGWVGDEVDVFNRKGLNEQQETILDFMSRLLRWRRSKNIFSHDNLVHFHPTNEVYVYGRKFEDEGVVVILNNSDQMVTLDFDHHAELFEGFLTGKNIISDMTIDDFSIITVPPHTPAVIDLYK